MRAQLEQRFLTLTRASMEVWEWVVALLTPARVYDAGTW